MRLTSTAQAETDEVDDVLFCGAEGAAWEVARHKERRTAGIAPGSPLTITNGKPPRTGGKDYTRRRRHASPARARPSSPVAGSGTTEVIGVTPALKVASLMPVSAKPTSVAPLKEST